MMQKALDGVWQRQKAIAANIANQETPGYKAVKVSFEAELENQVKLLKTSTFTSDENQENIFAIQNSNINFMKDFSTSERADGNNVNVEAENIDMAKTQIQYQYLTRGMSDMYSRLRYAISEGRK
jgi:flagellar basal-body rod protein FlgB